MITSSTPFPLAPDSLEPVIQTFLWFTFGLLALATVIYFSIKKWYPSAHSKEVGLRIKTWWYIVVAFYFGVVFDRTFALCLFAFICFMAFKEYLSIAPIRRSDREALLWAYMSIPITFYLISINWYGLYIIFIPLYMFLILATRTVLKGETKGFLYSVGSLHWGLMTSVFCLSHAAYLLVLPDDSNLSHSGIALLYYLLFLTQINDISQYLWGKSIGKRKIIPKVSPNKTWEGFLGGVLVTTALAVWMGPLLTPLTVFHSFWAGVLIGVGGFLGDVTISALKRDAGVKDTGALLPGHGGILDRLDSLVFTAPLFFHYIRYLYY